MTTIFSTDEVRSATLEYFKGDSLPTDVWMSKYALRNKEGEYLEKSPDDMHDRLSREFARIDAEKYGLDYAQRYSMYREAQHGFQRIVAQGSPMAAVGNTHSIMSASNCVVVEPPTDSISGIMKTATELAQLYKRRCGVGTDVSNLRPDGFTVNNAAKRTSGAWSFCDLYSYITRMIAMQGRRGALMLTINVHHPDVIKFARMKSDLSMVTGANVSIRLTDEFMQAVEAGEDYEQRWPCEEGETPKFKQSVSAKEVWDIIIENACNFAEPGLIFWDQIIRRLPAHSYPQFKTKSTNPCSEIALSAYDSCRLISLNLTGYVRNAFIKPEFDWQLFKRDISLAMQMIDNLVDIELELVKKIMNVCDSPEERDMWEKLYMAGEQGRRTGLGTHGLGDMFAQLNIKYDSEEALSFADTLYKCLRDSSYTASIDLAEARGSFPAFDWEIEKDNEFIRDLPAPILKRMQKVGRRNISILTQAPTGSVSLVSKCGEFDTHNISSGVEPVFKNVYTRRKKINPGDTEATIDYVDDLGDSWQEYSVFHGNVKNYLEKTGQPLTSELPDTFVTSEEIDWEFRSRLQGVEQHYIDHSISSTINLPAGTTPETVSQIYMSGWKNGLKGVTVYVDGSRSGVLVSEETKKLDESGRPKSISRIEAPKRPKELVAEIHHHSVKGEKWVAIVGLLNGEPYEMFGGYSKSIHLPKKYKTGTLVRESQGNYTLKIPVGDEEELLIKDILGTFDLPEIGWTTRLVSTSLRHGTPLEYMVQQLDKSPGSINSFNKVLARVLKKYISGTAAPSGLKCEKCGSANLKIQENCPVCLDCSFSKCN